MFRSIRRKGDKATPMSEAQERHMKKTLKMLRNKKKKAERRNLRSGRALLDFEADLDAGNTPLGFREDGRDKFGYDV